MACPLPVVGRVNPARQARQRHCCRLYNENPPVRCTLTHLLHFIRRPMSSLLCHSKRRQLHRQIAATELAVEPTRFAYRDSGDEYHNFLSTITDPLGATALSANYDPNTGRLLGLVDADGQAANLTYDTANLTVTSGSAAG